MQEITQEDYEKFIIDYKKVTIEDTELEIGGNHKINSLQPEDFKLETTTVWSFPKRGKWATHYLNAKYRGNWAPQVARNLILRYSKEGDTVLDAFAGSGTTIIECKITDRKGIAVDINKEAIMVVRDRLNFNTLKSDFQEQKTFLGDARNLNLISNNSIDLIAAHPPYANIISYTKNSNHKSNGDLSKVSSIDEFCYQMGNVASEFFRVLKQGGYCAILIGDTRRHKHQVPISFRVMQSFLDKGFVLKESIIKVQHNTKTAGLWANLSVKNNFLLLMHEHLFVFRKPFETEKQKDLIDSSKWWKNNGINYPKDKLQPDEALGIK
ncbi:DNA modification methylase [Candidatus Mancarchaeum acidiphilum]|uniref:Type II methyltransferase n=2 Tax=Candidatus Mancarchaeum acidiphilum TaxID=1920749 RepID=A0A218NMS1_9ARCH|nr:DNA modification methylase [Candidatus Mancarchaeum acidiphilum]